jgi:hypothetical protein
MEPKKSRTLIAGAIALWVLFCGGLFTFFSWSYTTSRLELARREGIYPTAEEGMRTMIARDYVGLQKVEIEYAGPNAFDGGSPHVWFVIARVWADSRADESPLHEMGYDYPGSFFLHTREGWVHVPEGVFPEFIGFWMPVFGWAAPAE